MSHTKTNPSLHPSCSLPEKEEPAGRGSQANSLVSQSLREKESIQALEAKQEE